MKYIISENIKKQEFHLSLQEYKSLEKGINYYKKIIEKLQDEIDSLEAEKIRCESKGTIKFCLNDYLKN